MAEEKFNDRKKLSLQQCKDVLNKNGEFYTDEEILKIRDFIYFIIDLEFEHYYTLNEEK